MLAKALMPLAEKLDRKFGWQRLPYYVGLATLIGLRERLRQNNLYSTGVPGVERPQPPGAREARRTDGSFNDLSQPGMGTRGRAVRAQRPGAPGPGSARRAAPARHQRRADGPHAVPARLAPQRARGRVAAVRGPRLDEPRQGAADRRVAAGRGHAAAEGDPDSRRPAGVRLPRAALVGRVAALRHAPGVHRRDRARARRDRRRRRPAARARTPGRELQRARGEPVGRARGAARPVRARAQRDRPPPARRVPRAGRAVAVREGAAGQLGADGQDPHRRVDARDHRPPDDGGRDQGHVVGLAGHEHRAHSGHEGQSPRCAVRADRGVRHGLPAAPAAARRLHARPARP